MKLYLSDEAYRMSTSSRTEDWLFYPRPKPRAALRLFCFPYAGSGAQVFQAWPTGLPENVEVCSVQLPGRGNRLRETPFTSLTLLVKAAAHALLPHMDRPFAFFGHSMGAMIGFELAHYLRAEKDRQPLHLFVSGRRAPQIPETDPPSYNLPEVEFLDHLRKLNGTPAEILEHPELMRLMLPLLRADFELVQMYEYIAKPPFDFPLTAFGGLQDTEANREDLEAWREHTNAEFSLQMLPGDHFFIHSAQALLLQALSKRVYRLPGNIDRGAIL